MLRLIASSTLEYRINGGGENNRGGGGGWKWFDITIIGEVGIIGGGVLEENSRFLSEQVSYLFM